MDRVCLVTGATSGIGRATAEALAADGDRVWLACRDAAKGERARAEIAAATGASPELLPLDLASLAAVRAAARAFADRVPRLDVLVNSAGHTFLAPERTADGLEAAFAVNVLGPFLLTTLLAPLLARSPAARVVDLAGIYHRRGELDPDDLFFERRGWAAWPVANATQSARVALVVERARRWPASVCVNAVHPGAVLTNAQRGLPWYARLLIHTVLRPGFVGPARGAAPVVRLATDPALDGVTGRFFDRLRPEDPGYAPALTAAVWARCAAWVGETAQG